MTLEDEKKASSDIILKEVETIRFENVSFKYPRSETFVLKNVSFNVKKGEKISIVGLNGAGKTTLVKLLCRLYRPSRGQIYVNNRNIFSYDYDSYIRQVAAVFQDYQLFSSSVKSNIISGMAFEESRVKDILKQLNLEERIANLPTGLDTPLNKNLDENGIELSGGQNQKIAIARALYKKASLIILDEPTSALDPLAEAEIYEHFNSLIQNKTAFYISHRMSSSIFCDRIVVIDAGTVAEIDTHANLMKKNNGLYYKLFQAQSQHYKN